jgi:hypothetical protein
MPDLIPAGPAPVSPSPARVALAESTPDIETLFRFAREAELRVRTLRLTIDEQVVNARGTQAIRHELVLRHPGQARVTTRMSSEPLSRDYRVWLSDGQTVTSFDARSNVASIRARRPRVAGSDDVRLPGFAQGYVPLTPLPSGSLADTFVHPHGLFRTVLVTGPLAVVGVQAVAGHEAVVVRARHPRSAKVLADRPDHSIEVGIGRDSGFLLSLTERFGEQVTRHAEVTRLELDPTLFDSAFELRLPADVRRVY